MSRSYAILMVCLGNICRSPTAEAVLRAKLAAAGLGDAVRVDSAGTAGCHEGAPPDHRSQDHAARRGYDLSVQRSRRLVAADFERHDLLLAMDWDNLDTMREACPLPHRSKLLRLMEFAPERGVEVIPDPYESGAAGFERVLDLIEAACDGLVAHLAKTHGG